MSDKIRKRWVSNTICSEESITASSSINEKVFDLRHNLTMEVVGARAEVRDDVAPDTFADTHQERANALLE